MTSLDPTSKYPSDASLQSCHMPLQHCSLLPCSRYETRPPVQPDHNQHHHREQRLLLQGDDQHNVLHWSLWNRHIVSGTLASSGRPAAVRPSWLHLQLGAGKHIDDFIDMIRDTRLDMSVLPLVFKGHLLNLPNCSSCSCCAADENFSFV